MVRGRYSIPYTRARSILNWRALFGETVHSACSFRAHDLTVLVHAYDLYQT